MKNMKKLAGILLVLVMVFAMTVPALAEEKQGSIAVTNAIANIDYTVYKVFDLTYNTDSDPAKVAYSYTKNSEFDALYAALTGTDSPFTLEATTVTGDYNVSVKDGKDTPDIVQFLVGLVENGTLTTSIESKKLQGGQTTVRFENLDLGYYYVSSAQGSVITLTSTLPNAEIVDKNEIIFDKTDSDAESVEIGQTVNYTINGNVPDWTGFSNYTYKITDTMSAGLTFQKDVNVTVGNGAGSLDLDDGTNNTTSPHKIKYTANGFELSIDVKALGEDKIGKAVTVTYTAVVNAQAVGVISENNATLTYSNDPTNTDSFETLEDPETVYTAQINIVKHETGKKGVKLQGADFILYKGEGTSKLYYQYKAAEGTTPAKVEWVAEQKNATVMTTDKDGLASFTGLANGTYHLLETKAPSGYNLLSGPVTVDIDGTGATATSLASLTVTKVVENSTGTVMPSTGGIGTTIFYIVGGVLLVGAGVLLVVRKRMSALKESNK